MMALPPEAAYRELRSYGEYLVSEASGYGEDEELEVAMVSREDPVITLGVAEFGGSSQVLKALFDRARRGKGEHDRAVRIAILGNRNVRFGRGITCHPYGVISEEEAKRIVTSRERDEQEIEALLLNPGGITILDDLLNKKGAFAELPEEDLLAMIRLASTNPSLNERPWSDSGWFHQVGEGIRSLLQQTPASEQALDTFYWLLLNLDPVQAGSFDEDPAPIFARWRALSMGEKFEEEQRYLRHTGLSFKDEFCCLMAALYGRWYSQDKQSSPIPHDVGTAESPDIVLRCAHYGHAQMTVEQMEQAHERDNDAFTLTALFNEELFEDNTKRAKLEGFLDLDLWLLYARRCRQIAARKPDFDPKPVTEDAAELEEGLDQEELEEEGVLPKDSDEQKLMRRLETNLTALSSEVARLKALISWGSIILIVVLVILIWDRIYSRA
jgi:hypothetical protein